MTPALPIDEHLERAVGLLQTRGSLVVKAPPGAGKTTRLPAALLDHDLVRPGQEVLVLEPRRLAARAAAERVARERGASVGEEVGYQVRFEEVASKKTRLRYVTEGVFVRRLVADPELKGIGAVILDEFHERTLDADLSLALLRALRPALRPDLRVVVMSATLDPEPIAAFLEGAETLVSEGRQYPVAIEFARRPESSPLGVRIAQALEGARPESALVFLPGWSEIRETTTALSAFASRTGAEILPLHGDLPLEEQQRALSVGPRPRIVLATNVAEASVTVDGVSLVIDAGLARRMRYDAVRGVNRLSTSRISRASAAQRAGRAGRLGPGRCLRLYTEAEHAAFAEFDEPEIRRVDLADAFLLLHGQELVDPAELHWLTPADAAVAARAERLLEQLGAIAGTPPRLTETGRRMWRVPASARMGRLLLEAARLGEPESGALIAALLSERDPFRDFGAPAPERSSTSDLWPAFDAVAAARRRLPVDPGAPAASRCRQIVRAADQLRRSLAPVHARPAPDRESTGSADVALRKAVLAGHPDRVVRRHRPGSAGGLMVGGIGVRLDRESAVREGGYFVAHDLHQEHRDGALVVRVRRATSIEPEWLGELWPDAVRRELETRFDPETERVRGFLVERYHDLALAERETGKVDPADAEAKLAAAALSNVAGAATWDEAAAGFVQRVDSLLEWRPELGERFGFASGQAAAELFRLALPALAAGKRSFAELRRDSLVEFLDRAVPHGARADLERLAPSRLVLPSGRAASVEYRTGQAPVVAARLQEFFGLRSTPSLNQGRTPVVLHLLAPNHRPLQVTTDLASFWENVYPKVRPQLRARYPKHSWPDDPASAEAEARPRRPRTPGTR